MLPLTPQVQLLPVWCWALLVMSAHAAATCPPSNFTTQFERSGAFNLSTFISARWYVQQQMEGGLEPGNLFQCQFTEYTRLAKRTFWGFSIQGHDHIDHIPPNGTSLDLHPCVDVVDEAHGKLEVGQCFLPKALAGPYWVYAYDEADGYAAVGGGKPTESFPGGCRTGTGHTNSGLWIFTRAQQRAEGLVQKARSALAGLGFDLKALQDVRQTGCPPPEVPTTIDSEAEPHARAEANFTWELPFCDGGHGGQFRISPGENKTVYSTWDCTRVGPLVCALSKDGTYLTGHGYYEDSQTPRYYWNGKPVKQTDPPEPYSGPCSRRDEDEAACCWPTP